MNRLTAMKEELNSFCADLTIDRLNKLTPEQVWRIDAVEVVFDGSGCETEEEALSSALFSEYEEIISGR